MKEIEIQNEKNLLNEMCEMSAFRIDNNNDGLTKYESSGWV